MDGTLICLMHISCSLHVYTPSRQLRFSSDSRTPHIPHIKIRLFGHHSFFMLLRLSGIPYLEIKRVNFRQPAVGGDGKHEHVRHVHDQLAVSLTSFRSVPQGWLEPLLHGILHNPFVTVYPMTETIHDASLWTQETKRVDNRGIFRWKDLNFLWEYLPAYERDRRKSLADPIRCLSGGKAWQTLSGICLVDVLGKLQRAILICTTHRQSVHWLTGLFVKRFMNP